MKKALFAILSTGVLALTGCHNSEVEFLDFDYQTISFAHSTPVRTITLGDETYADNTIDNEHACEIKAVLGGVNTNKKDRWVNFTIDNSLCDRILYSDGSPVVAMPASYYTYSDERINIKKGEVIGGFRVQLTDAFFADPKSTEVCYVIPVVLTQASDSILQGKAKEGIVAPDRLNSDDWSTLPKDYVLYAIKYKNPYHGCWLSKGTDKVEHNGETSTVNRQTQYWEKASLRYLTTKSLTRSAYTFTHPVETVDANGEPSEKSLQCVLFIDIDGNGNVTVSTESEGCTASGSGKWTHLGEPKAWGDADRDRLELNFTYAITYVKNDQTGETATYKVSTEEVMCMRDRQNKREDFSYIMK